MGESKDLVIGWIDNGDVTNQLAIGVSNFLCDKSHGIKVERCISSSGCIIANNRIQLAKSFFYKTQAEWFLTLDSDIEVNTSHINKLWQAKDKFLRPIVTGVYYGVQPTNTTLPMPMPYIFHGEKENGGAFLFSEIDKDKVIPITRSGLGIALIHRSVFARLFDKFDKKNFYAEIWKDDGSVMGEDFRFFFECKALGIPTYAHTGVVPKHHKRIPIDLDYANLYWSKHRVVQEEGDE